MSNYILKFSKVQDMSTKLRSVQSLATQTLKDSTDSYNLALNIYQQALAMQVPTVDNRDLEDKARKVTLTREFKTHK